MRHYKRVQEPAGTMKRGLIADYVLQSFEDDIWKPELDAHTAGGRGRLEGR